MAKRAIGEGSIYPHGVGRWAAGVTYVDETGSRRRTLYGRTQKEIRAKRDVAPRRAREGLAPTDAKVSARDYTATGVSVGLATMSVGGYTSGTRRIECDSSSPTATSVKNPYPSRISTVVKHRQSSPERSLKAVVSFAGSRACPHGDPRPGDPGQGTRAEGEPEQDVNRPISTWMTI